MADTLNAIIAKAAAFAPLPVWLNENEIVELAQDYQMVPVTDDMASRLSSNIPGPTARLKVFTI